MKNFIKEFFEGLLKILIILLLIVFSPLILIWIIVATITDYLKYKKTRYYKDTNERYSWLCADTYYIHLYDCIKEAELPIEYYRDNSNSKLTGYGYFIYDDILIYADFDADMLYFDKDKNEWMIYDEHDYLLLEPEMEEELEKVNSFLGKEVCKKVVLLVENEMLEEVPVKTYEKVEFVPVTDDDKVSALKNIVG